MSDMRKKYDDWVVSVLGCSPMSNFGWEAWQAATASATAVERERCAAVCYFVGGKDTNFEAYDCAKAIRQGGAT